MDPHSIIVINLHTPKEKIWGELLSINPSGVTLRGIDLNSFDHYRWALLILIIAGCTDGIDGLLARTLNQKSALGAYLDPIADKLLLSSSFVILAMAKKVAWWLTIMVLSRDVLLLVVAAVIILISGYRPFPPSLYGKLTTFFQIVFVFAVVLAAAFPYNHWVEVNRVLIYTVTALTVFSGFHYCFATARKLSS